MTRIPHDSPELENWFSAAKQADSVLAPGSAELDKLAAALSSGPAGTALTGSALLSAPAAKAALGAVAVAGGLLLAPLRASPPSPSEAPSLKSKSAVESVRAPVAREVELLPLDSSHTPLTSPPAPAAPAAPSPPSPRIRASVQPPTAPWMKVNDALTEGDLPAAREALENFIRREDGVAKERAELALAQLELTGPHSSRAQATLRRLASRARESSVRIRAQSLLTSSKEH